ncbi:MAG: cation-transporting P-type ATPase, partial [Planctomycetota bacterium]
MSEQDWHAISGDEAVQRLNSRGEQGLAQQEAEQRLQRDGPNSIGEGEQVTWWQVLLRQFLSPLIYVLLGAF